MILLILIIKILLLIIILLCKYKYKYKKKRIIDNYDDIDKITIEYLYWKKLFYKAYTLNSIKKNFINFQKCKLNKLS